jgi:hypothetical protein
MELKHQMEQCTSLRHKLKETPQQFGSIAIVITTSNDLWTIRQNYQEYRWSVGETETYQYTFRQSWTDLASEQTPIPKLSEHRNRESCTMIRGKPWTLHRMPKQTTQKRITMLLQLIESTKILYSYEQYSVGVHNTSMLTYRSSAHKERRHKM